HQGCEPERAEAAGPSAAVGRRRSHGTDARRARFGGSRRRRTRLLRPRSGSRVPVLSRRTADRRHHHRHRRSLEHRENPGTLEPWNPRTGNMQICRVVGTVVSTQKNRKLEGAKLLLVQPLTLADAPRGTTLLAIDSVGAGVGEKVLV